MNSEIKNIIEAVSNEKDISEQIVFEAIEAALESASKKRYGSDWDIKVSLDPLSGEYETFRRFTIVEEDFLDSEEFNPSAHYTLEQVAVKRPEHTVDIGDTILDPIESVAFGRIAAQTAKQVISQRLRAAKRDKMAQEYRSKVGTLVSGAVKKVTRDFVIVELGGNAEAVLKRSEMLPREIVRMGDRVRAYLYDVKSDARGPQLLISRVCPEMLIELFKIEVPEIGDGMIEVKGAARDPGSRAKVAVLAKDNRIDPVGACVGMRGSRVQAVSNELGGERVDIVLWDENPAQYVINAIAPAEVASIVLDDDAHAIDVIVTEDQLSVAIGRSGQNVRMASQLVGWELNMMSEKEAEEKEDQENERLLKLFSEHLVLDEEKAIAVIEAGFTSIEEIAYVPLQELQEIEGIDEEGINSIREKAKDALLTKAIAQEERLDENEPANDLLELEGMTRHLAYTLAAKGILTREDLAEQSVDDLIGVEGLEEESAGKLIMVARAPWFVENE